MNVVFTRSFERSLKSRGQDKESIKRIIRKAVAAMEISVKPKGLGFKKLRDDLWEVRSGLKIRIQFSLNPGEIRLLLVGTHDQIRTFLKKPSIRRGYET